MRSQFNTIADVVFRARFAAVAVVALLAGCGSYETPAGRPASAPSNLAPAPEKASEEAPETASESASGAAQTSQATPEALIGAASNGADLAACKDAECEVEVVPGDRLKIDPRFGVNAISVKSLGVEEIMLALEGSSGSLRVEGSGVSTTSSCTNGRCRDEGVLSLTADRPGRVNAIQLRLAAANPARAVLVLQPR